MHFTLLVYEIKTLPALCSFIVLKDRKGLDIEKEKNNYRSFVDFTRPFTNQANKPSNIIRN